MYFARIFIVYFLASDVTIWDSSGEWTEILLRWKK